MELPTDALAFSEGEKNSNSLFRNSTFSADAAYSAPVATDFSLTYPKYQHVVGTLAAHKCNKSHSYVTSLIHVFHVSCPVSGTFFDGHHVHSLETGIHVVIRLRRVGHELKGIFSQAGRR